MYNVVQKVYEQKDKVPVRDAETKRLLKQLFNQVFEIMDSSGKCQGERGVVQETVNSWIDSTTIAYHSPSGVDDERRGDLVAAISCTILAVMELASDAELPLTEALTLVFSHYVLTKGDIPETTPSTIAGLFNKGENNEEVE